MKSNLGHGQAVVRLSKLGYLGSWLRDFFVAVRRLSFSSYSQYSQDSQFEKQLTAVAALAARRTSTNRKLKNVGDVEIT